MTNNNFVEEVEMGSVGLRARYWSDFIGEWWDSFCRMACQQINGSNYDYAMVPVLILDYLTAPTEWVMASGKGGET